MLTTFGICCFASAAWGASAQFDLMCETRPEPPPDGLAKFFGAEAKAPEAFGFIVDLDSMQFCFRDAATGQCKTEQGVQKIKEVTQSTITFARTDDATLNSQTVPDIMVTHTVNRITGEYYFDFFSKPIAGLGLMPTRIHKEGKCEPAPFTGFPATKF